VSDTRSVAGVWWWCWPAGERPWPLHCDAVAFLQPLGAQHSTAQHSLACSVLARGSGARLACVRRAAVRAPACNRLHTPLHSHAHAVEKPGVQGGARPLGADAVNWGYWMLFRCPEDDDKWYRLAVHRYDPAMQKYWVRACAALPCAACCVARWHHVLPGTQLDTCMCGV
jgi:hypothetical protein